MKFHKMTCPVHGDVIITENRVDNRICHECAIDKIVGIIPSTSGIALLGRLRGQESLVKEKCEAMHLPFHPMRYRMLVWFFTIYSNDSGFYHTINDAYTKNATNRKGRIYNANLFAMMSKVVADANFDYANLIKSVVVFKNESLTTETIAKLINLDCGYDVKTFYPFDAIYMLRADKIRFSLFDSALPAEKPTKEFSSDDALPISDIQDVSTEATETTPKWFDSILADDIISTYSIIRHFALWDSFAFWDSNYFNAKRNTIGFFKLEQAHWEALIRLNIDRNFIVFRFGITDHNNGHYIDSITIRHPLFRRYFIAFNDFREVVARVNNSFFTGYSNDSIGLDKVMCEGGAIPVLNYLASSANAPIESILNYLDDTQKTFAHILGPQGISSIGSKNFKSERYALRNDLDTTWKVIADVVGEICSFMTAISFCSCPKLPSANETIGESTGYDVIKKIRCMWDIVSAINPEIKKDIFDIYMGSYETMIESVDDAFNENQSITIGDVMIEHRPVILSIYSLLHDIIPDFPKEQELLTILIDALHGHYWAGLDDTEVSVIDLPEAHNPTPSNMTIESNGVTEAISLADAEEVTQQVVVGEVVGEESVTPITEPKKFFSVREVDDTNLHRIMSVIYGFYRGMGHHDHVIVSEIDSGCEAFLMAVNESNMVSDATKKMLNETLFSDDITEDTLMELTRIGIDVQASFHYLITAKTDKNPLRTWRVWSEAIKELSEVTGMSADQVTLAMQDIIKATKPTIKKVFLRIFKQ